MKVNTNPIISRVISPNLDELLEHEDETRARLMSIVSVSEMSTSTRSVSPGNGGNEEFVVGLPPPPRHPRVKLPRATTRPLKPNLILSEQPRGAPAKPTLTVQPLSGSSSISNPFINPAPTLAELLIPSRLEPSNDQISELSSLRSDGSESPIVFTSPWSTVDVHPPIQISGDRHRQHNFVADNQTKPWRINSRAKRPSTSPGYTHTSSTREPAHTKTGSSISISTTVYPPSDKDSYPYNDQVLSNSGKSHLLSQREDSTSMDCPQISPIQFARRLSDSWPSFSSDPSHSSSNPPDLPTTLLMKPGTPRPLPPIPTTSVAPMPPTTNFLESGERADLVRITRKLARVFGKTPGADVTGQEPSLSSMSRYSSNSEWSRRRSALQSELEFRGHSAPQSPDDVSPVTPSSQGSLTPSKDQPGHHVQVQIQVQTMTVNDTASVMLEADKTTKPLPSIPSHSQLETMFEDEQGDERRRKREKLAKLHRFLGSRVPINLILGIDDNVEASLPSPYFSPISPLYRNEDRQSTWLKRRKSSSAILSSLHWSNDLERVKEELNEQEKLINVRRAVKMEKVFGVAPPQTLYHTRLCPSPSSPANNLAPSFEGPSLTGSVQRNSNRSTYMKQKSKKNGRPGTADSDSHLVPKAQGTSDNNVASAWETGHSNIYNSYQYSLNSLKDILAWDDRESLVELHQYLNTEEDLSSPFEVSPVGTARRMSNASSFGRRRSLPALSSRVSLDSEYNATEPETNITKFQVRRRKAAKLTQFFGVDYRELINDVLQSIENGVKNERNSGTLRAEEAEDLLAKLRKLKIKRPRSQSFLCMD